MLGVFIINETICTSTSDCSSLLSHSHERWEETNILMRWQQRIADSKNTLEGFYQRTSKVVLISDEVRRHTMLDELTFKTKVLKGLICIRFEFKSGLGDIKG